MGKTVKRCFIRGLWGDGNFRRYDKVRRDVTKATREKHLPSPMRVYVYGEANHFFLKSLNVPCHLVAKESVVNFTGDADRNAHQDYTGSYCYGMSSWRHKLDVLERALSEFEEVIWLDWDVRQCEKLPRDFWERFADGREFQAAIKQYRRLQCLWRKDRLDRRKIPHGAFIYCRSQKAIREIIEVHKTIPLSMDEHAYMKWIEQQTPWVSPEAYKEAGWEPWCYYHAESVFIPEQVLFVEHMNKRARQKVRDELRLRKGAVG